MHKYKIDELPDLLRTGKITEKEGTDILWEEIYTHPVLYGLARFSEDQKSEFLIKMQQKFCFLFKKFVPGIVPFSIFIKNCIPYYKQTFLREEKKQAASQNFLNAYMKFEIEKDFYKYNAEHKISRYESTEENARNFSDITEQRPDTKEKRKKRTADLVTLILMMKACTDIDDEVIQNVSNFTGVEKDALYNAVQTLKGTMKIREHKRNLLIEKRNNAFFFHRKYMMQMAHGNATEAILEKIKEKYETRTDAWKRNNAILENRIQAAPSDKEVGKVLGIKPRMVNFYINHARNEKNISAIKSFYEKMNEDAEKHAESGRTEESKIQEKE